MELKVLTFSIILQGASITKTILYNDNEYVSIEDYSLYNTDTIYSRVSFYVFGSENLIELSEGVISLRSSKYYEADSWTIVGEKEEEWKINVEKIDDKHLELIKTSSLLEKKIRLQRTKINKQLSKTVPQILEYEDNLYLTVSSSTFSNKREIFRIELLSDRDANSTEIEKFNSYKTILKQ